MYDIYTIIKSFDLSFSMEPVRDVSIYGATLSLLLKSVMASSGGNFDGLLLGHYKTLRETRYEDEESGPRLMSIEDQYL